MDVTELLMQDHRQVEQLFDDYKDGKDEATLERICQALEVHTTIEEEIVYPRLAEIDAELEQHAEDDHAKAKQLIAQIRSRPADVSSVAEELQEAVQHHVEDEESKAFPAMRDRLGAELDELGATAEKLKQQLMSQQA